MVSNTTFLGARGTVTVSGYLIIPVRPLLACGGGGVEATVSGVRGVGLVEVLLVPLVNTKPESVSWLGVAMVTYL